MRRCEGSLTVEASIALTFFMMFVLFFIGLNRVHTAQNVVSHGVIQTAQNISVNSFFRKEMSKTSVGDIYGVFKRLIDGTPAGELLSDDIIELKHMDISSLVKKGFNRIIAGEGEDADVILKQLGVENLTFSECKLEDGDIFIQVKYDVKLQFPFLGNDKVSMVKTAKSRLFEKEHDDD